MLKIKNQYITTPCWKCEGTGIEVMETAPYSRNCPICKGFGYTPNKEGKDIIEMFRTFGKSIL
jgi:DnaJ-class molecular chaperone